MSNSDILVFEYKEFNAKIGTDVEHELHYSDDLVRHFAEQYPSNVFNQMVNQTVNQPKYYTFNKSSSIIPSLSNNCIVWGVKGFNPPSTTILGTIISDFKEKLYRDRYKHKPLFLYEYDYLPNINTVKQRCEYIEYGDYLFICSRKYVSNDELRTVFHIEKAPTDYPNIIINDSYIVVCSKKSLKELERNVAGSKKDMVYLALIDTTSSEERDKYFHSIASDTKKADNYTQIKTAGIVYMFYEVAQIYLEESLKPLSLAILGNNLCLFKYNYRCCYSISNIDNTRVPSLTFHWFCGANIATYYRYYDTDLEYDRQIPLVFTNTEYQFTNIYTPLFFMKEYSSLVHSFYSGNKEIIQIMRLDINDGTKNVILNTVDSNDNKNTRLFEIKKDKPDTYPFSTGNILNKLVDNIPQNLDAQVFTPNICKASEYFPHAITGTQAIVYGDDDKYSIYECTAGKCHDENCEPGEWTSMKNYNNINTPINTDNIEFSEGKSYFNKDYKTIVPIYVKQTSSESNKDSSSNVKAIVNASLFNTLMSKFSNIFVISIAIAVVIAIIIAVIFIMKMKKSA